MSAFRPTVVFAALLMLMYGVTFRTSAGAAHHSFAAEFDENDCRDFTGELTKLDWQSPHGYFYVDVEDEDGNVENWQFQTYSLITLRRNGTERQLFIENMNQEIWVRGCVAKNGRQHYAAAGLLRFPDGVLHQVGQIQN